MTNQHKYNGLSEIFNKTGKKIKECSKQVSKQGSHESKFFRVGEGEMQARRKENERKAKNELPSSFFFLSLSLPLSLLSLKHTLTILTYSPTTTPPKTPPEPFRPKKEKSFTFFPNLALLALTKIKKSHFLLPLVRQNQYMYLLLVVFSSYLLGSCGVFFFSRQRKV